VGPRTRPATTRRLTLLSVALGAALVGGLALPATAAAPSYVALGDSYSSGTGTRQYLADGTSCQRSARSYPALVAAAKGYALDLRACSGATVADVTRTQLGALTTATRYVTVSVGGNDAGFAPVLTECAKPGWMSSCNGAIDGAEAVITGRLPASLDALYGQIRSRAPQAKVVVVGYPRIFMGEDCNAFTWFSPAEQSRLNAVADRANSVIAAAAARAGFGFSNPTAAFTGHAVCDDPEWLNGLSNPIGESYHPNVAGHASGYTPLVAGPLTGAPLAVTAATVAAADASAPRLTERAATHAAADRTITPKTFVLPDLRSPQAKAAAARAGVDLSSRASIDAADRRYSKAQAAAHAAGD
jgi:lysophospholipase L1-like esterase